MKEKWLVSVMLSVGPKTQYVMTDHMSKAEAAAYADELLDDAERERFVKVGNTMINPAYIVTVRVVRDRPYDRGAEVDI